jgi:hypothetical protein
VDKPLPDVTYGRVVVTHMNYPGYICPDGFDNNDANVLCKEAGYAGGIAFNYYNYRYGVTRQDEKFVIYERKLTDLHVPSWFCSCLNDLLLGDDNDEDDDGCNNNSLLMIMVMMMVMMMMMIAMTTILTAADDDGGDYDSHDDDDDDDGDGDYSYDNDDDGDNYVSPVDDDDDDDDN